MLEVVWPRVRTLARVVGFLLGLVAIAAAVWSIIQTPAAFRATGEETAAHIAAELLVIVGASLWVLFVTKY